MLRRREHRPTGISARAALRSAPVGDAARMATVIVRRDRFCEGSIAAVLERLLPWYDVELVG